MTPEQEAEARALLAQIAETQEWAREKCPGPGWLREHDLKAYNSEGRCNRCDDKTWTVLANLEVAAWRATVFLDGEDYLDPIIVVLSAVLALSKEKADA